MLRSKSATWETLVIQEAGIKMSMRSLAEANENSMVERLNRTLKEGFFLGNGF
jgi:hypothetical protein